MLTFLVSFDIDVYMLTFSPSGGAFLRYGVFFVIYRGAVKTRNSQYSFRSHYSERHGIRYVEGSSPVFLARTSQVMLVVNQQAWTHTMETVIQQMPGDGEALHKHWEFSCQVLPSIKHCCASRRITCRTPWLRNRPSELHLLFTVEYFDDQSAVVGCHVVRDYRRPVLCAKRPLARRTRKPDAV